MKSCSFFNFLPATSQESGTGPVLDDAATSGVGSGLAAKDSVVRWKIRVVHDGLPVMFMAVAAFIFLSGIISGGSYDSGDMDDNMNMTTNDDDDDENPAMIYSGLIDICEHVNPQMAQAWLNPFTSVILACFVPPLYLLVQLIRKYNLSAAIEETTAQGVQLVGAQADEAHATVAEAEEKANEALEEAEASTRQHGEVFFLLLNTGISLWALIGYLSAELRPKGGGICMAAYFTAAVQYKPFALSMFAAVSHVF